MNRIHDHPDRLKTDKITSETTNVIRVSHYSVLGFTVQHILGRLDGSAEEDMNGRPPVPVSYSVAANPCVGGARQGRPFAPCCPFVSQVEAVRCIFSCETPPPVSSISSSAHCYGIAAKLQQAGYTSPP